MVYSNKVMSDDILGELLLLVTGLYKLDDNLVISDYVCFIFLVFNSSLTVAPRYSLESNLIFLCLIILCRVVSTHLRLTVIMPTMLGELKQ